MCVQFRSRFLIFGKANRKAFLWMESSLGAARDLIEDLKLKSTSVKAVLMVIEPEGHHTIFL